MALGSTVTVLGCEEVLGDNANAEVFLELLEEHEGEHCVGNQADPCRNETLQQNLIIIHI